jgi:hypothetical protein
MPAPTLPGPLDGAGFKGKTKSFTILPGGKSWPTCPSRRESVKVRTIGGTRMNVEKYRCGCLTGLEVRREAA